MENSIKKQVNKLLSFCLAVVMVLTSLAVTPMVANAEEGTVTRNLYFKLPEGTTVSDWGFNCWGASDADTVEVTSAGEVGVVGGTWGTEQSKPTLLAGEDGWGYVTVSITGAVGGIQFVQLLGEDADASTAPTVYPCWDAEITNNEIENAYYNPADGVWYKGADLSERLSAEDTGISEPDKTQLKLYYYILDDTGNDFGDYAVNVWGGAALTEAGPYLNITAWEGNQKYRTLIDANKVNTIDGLNGKWGYVGLDSNSVEGQQFLTTAGGDNVWNSAIVAQNLTEAYYVPGYGWFKEAECENEIKALELQEDEFYIIGGVPQDAEGNAEALGNWTLANAVKMTKTSEGVYEVTVSLTAGTYEFTPVQDPVQFAWEHQYKDYDNNWANYTITLEEDSDVVFTVKNPDVTTGKAEVTAVKKVNAFTVTFKDGEEVLKTETVEPGKAATAPALPTKAGYTASWDKDFTNVTADMTVNVVWTANKTFTVTFKDGDTVLKTETVETGKAATAPALPAKAGYTAGWDKDFAKVTADTTVNVAWTPNTYTLTYDVNGGTKLKTSTKAITYDSTYGELAKPSRKGYAFKGWYTAKTKGTKVTSSTKVTGDATVYAQWTKVTKPGKVTIKSVKNSSKKAAKVTLKKVKGADGYEVRYATKKNMKGAKKVTTAKTTVTIKSLKKGKTYYVQVRAYKLDSAGKKVYSSKYSTTKTVKIKK